MGAYDDIDYEEESLQLEPGDMLVMFTDGVTEAMNPSNKEFGEERLDAILSRQAGKGSQEMVESIKAGIAEFVEDAEQSDDITMLVLKRK